jgi:uncharacterized protein with FMN-binding domain
VRTRAALSSIAASIGVLVIGWQFGSAAMAQQTTALAPTTTDTTASNGTTTTNTGTTTGPVAATSSTTTTAGAKDGTYTGSSVRTYFGNVQVSVTIANGKITDVKALQLTNADGRSRQISNYAAPILRSEVLQSQSAHVSNVGGATYTTGGYLQSLQSALDQAGF